MLAWTSYDVASSTYIGVVPTVLFPIFYLTVVNTGAAGLLSWGVGVSVALLVAGLAAPFIGKVADRDQSRWHFLVITTLLCCAATAALALVQPGQSVLALVAFALAQAAYSLSQPLYESYLPMLARAADSGRVSAFGWAIGFMGGIMIIVVLLPVASHASGHALFAESFMLVGLLFAIIAGPALWFLRRVVEGERTDRVQPERPSIWQTVRQWRLNRELFKVIVAFYMVNSAMVTISVFAAEYFRSSFGASVHELLVLMLVYTVIALPATFVFGVLGDRWTHGSAILVSLSIWAGAVVLMALGTATWVPMVVVVLLGLVYGSTQALFRSLIALWVPRGREAEFFGFNAAAGRISASVGPVLYGVIATTTGDSRMALLSMIFFVVAGAGILTVTADPLRKASLL
ncbi:MAG: MFS transporter [Rhizobiaceae bacterium]|nr:MFS transporter [Rhizobiaceae bacterium]